MNDRDSTYADQLLGQALRLVTAGVDPELGAETVADALAALAKQAKALRAVEYESTKMKSATGTCPDCGAKVLVEVALPNHEALAKTMAQTAKMIDETARLVQFTSGKPDSRPDVSGMPVDILKALTDPQLKELMGWVTENGRLQEDAAERDSAA